MATAIVSSFLSDNNNTTPFDEIALKIYSGMVLEAFNKATVTEGRHMQRSISNGKSAQFPVFGPGAVSTHTRGTEVTFGEIGSTEKVIVIEDLIMAPLFLDVLDEAKSHFDIRRPYATQQGQTLAEETDRRVLQVFISAANATASITYPVGQETGVGARVAYATVATDAAVLKGAIYESAENLDTNAVPSSERYLFVSPAQYYLLLQDGEFIDRDFNDSGNGSRASAVMRNAADFEVVKTTNFPSVTGVGNTAIPVEQRVDYTLSVAIAAHSSAAGSVTLMGLGFDSMYDPNRQGHMLIAKYAKGFGILRPEAAMEICTS